MSTTLQLVREEMLLSNVEELGRVLETPTSITTTTAVFASLATGGVLAEKFMYKWLVRPDAASAADRVRRISDFATASGTITHAGTNYADTTPGTEVCEILAFEPRLYDDAINWTLDRTKRLDRTEVLSQGGRNYLSSLTWLESPSKVRRIKRVSGTQLSRNRDFSKWNAYNSGALIPDDWALTGTGCTVARGGTFTWRGAPYSLSVTPAVAVAATVTQTPGLAEDGVTADSLRGDIVTVTGRIRCTDASNARVWVSEDGGATKNYSGYHTGGSSFEELTAEYTITSAATGLSFGMESAANKSVCQVGELWLDYGSLTDVARRGIPAEETIWDYRYAGQAGLPLVLSSTGKGTTYAIYSERGYPQIDTSRITAGSADDDVIDAPKTLIAAGAIWRLFETVSGSDHNDAPRWKALADEWRVKYEMMHRAHLLELDANEPGWRPRGRVYGYPSRAGV